MMKRILVGSSSTKRLFVIAFFILTMSSGCLGRAATPVATQTPDTVATEQGLVLRQTQAAVNATADALSATQTQLAAATPTPVPTETPAPTNTPEPTPTPAGPVIISDDFSSDTGRFKCDECKIVDGVLRMGPFPAMDSVNGYYAICSDCPEVASYKMSVDATFDDGASDRGFGLVLRENDGSFIDLEILTWQYYGVWHFDAQVGNTWRAWDKAYTSGGFIPGNLRAGRGTNKIEVIMTSASSGSSLRILFNGKGARTLELPGGSGRVGLIVGMHSLGVVFDNFYFEELP